MRDRGTGPSTTSKRSPFKSAFTTRRSAHLRALSVPRLRNASPIAGLAAHPQVGSCSSWGQARVKEQRIVRCGRTHGCSVPALSHMVSGMVSGRERMGL